MSNANWLPFFFSNTLFETCFQARRRDEAAKTYYKDYYAFTEMLMDIHHACSNWGTVKASAIVAPRKFVYRG